MRRARRLLKRIVLVLLTALLSYLVILMIHTTSTGAPRATLVHGARHAVHSTPRPRLVVYKKPTTTAHRNPASKLDIMQELRTEEMFSKETSDCSGLFRGLGGTSALLSNVTLDRSKVHGRNKGGESIKSVLNQRESDEYFTMEHGFLQLKSESCKKPASNFGHTDHLSRWFKALDFTEGSIKNRGEVYLPPVIVVQRYEYANIYHTMTDWYNAFLLMTYYRLDSNSTHALLMDAHPIGALDGVWDNLFSSTRRLSSLPEVTSFRSLYWNPLGYFSMLLKHSRSEVPLLEHFRAWFLQRHDVDAGSKLHCRSPRVTFLFRKDYLAHPRNPRGTVQRKVANEQELVSAVRRRFITFRVRNISTEALSMRQQLQAFSQTDILVGMHGAGLTHALFLPQHGALFEMYPAYFSNANQHFKAIARWRHIKYRQWVNKDHSLELSNFRTRIPVDMLLGTINELHCNMCPGECEAS